MYDSPCTHTVDSNQECKITNHQDSDRVTQYMAVIIKLVMKRSYEGIRNFKPSRGTNLAKKF